MAYCREPAISITVRETVKLASGPQPKASYLCSGFCKLDVEPSPKSQLYIRLPEAVEVNRINTPEQELLFVKVKLTEGAATRLQ